jgi:phosphopantetheine adenylyltransferase
LSRKRRDKRMDQLRERNGSKRLDILVIGMITAKKVLVFSFIKMETNMKECGNRIRDMGRVHTGEMSQAS